MYSTPQVSYFAARPTFRTVKSAIDAGYFLVAKGADGILCRRLSADGGRWEFATLRFDEAAVATPSLGE